MRSHLRLKPAGQGVPSGTAGPATALRRAHAELAGGPMTEDAPWNQDVDLAEVSRGRVVRVLDADEPARKRIARALGIDQLDQLEAKVTLTPWLDGAEVDGRWCASIEQTCGFSLDRFASEMEGAFLLRVLPAGSPNAPRETGPEVAVDPDAPDPADVLEGES